MFSTTKKSVNKSAPKKTMIVKALALFILAMALIWTTPSSYAAPQTQVATATTMQPVGCPTSVSWSSTRIFGSGGLKLCMNSNTLIFQTDGNLVLYYNNGSLPWSTKTWGNPGAVLALQGDGNMVIYSRAGKVLWNSQSWGTNNTTVKVLSLSDGRAKLHFNYSIPVGVLTSKLAWDNIHGVYGQGSTY